MSKEVKRSLTARIIREGAGDECVFVAEKNFYCYATTGGNPQAVMHVILQKVMEEVTSYEYDTGRDFEESVIEAFHRAGAKDGISFACIFNQHETLLLVTQTQGEIYIQRDGKTMKLLDGNRHAAGTLHEDDIFILTTSPSSVALRDIGGWGAYLNGANINGKDLSGLILTAGMVEEVEKSVPRVARTEPKKEKKPSAIMTKLKSMERRQIIKAGIVGFIALLLAVSLTYGLIRRANDKRAQQITVTKEEVAQKLQQAEDVAFLNSGRAAGLINDAKHDVAQLKEQLGGKDTKDIQEMNNMIAEKEASIFKKEEKKPEEFFDLGIEDKNARGALVARNGNNAAIADPNGNIYLLNLEKKSLDKQSSGVKDAAGIAVADSSVFVLGQNGVVQVTQDGKAKKIIDRDNDWGKITSIVTFNNNIYLLDSGKGQVVKYVPAGDGYGGKSSYVKGNAPSFVGAASLAIDSSVYVASDATILKFTAGLQEGFSPQFPDGGVTITKVDTAEDVEKVYAWDKPKGLVYIMSKNGSYERQIKSSALKSANDITVTKTDIFLLQGQKIYKIGLD